MDGDAQAGVLVSVSVAGSLRKRPRPSGANQDQGVDAGIDGDDYASHRLRRRQNSSLPRPLTLLARCALNLGDQTNSHNPSGGPNQQFRFRSPSTSTGGATRHPHQHQHQHSTNNNTDNNTLQLPGHAQNVQENTSPAGSSTQNTAPLHGTNPCMNQEMVGMQPDNMPASQYFASMQTPSTGANGSLLRPFGMTPQELLNYALLVNILQKSTTQGNAAMSDIAFNCSQAAQWHNIVQGGNNSIANSSAATASTPLAGIQQQGCSEYRLHDEPNQFLKAQACSNDSGNFDGSGGPPPGNGAYRDGNETLHLTNPHQSRVARELRNSPTANRACTDGGNDSFNDGNCIDANARSVPKRNDAAPALPSHVLRAQRDVPGRRSVPLWTPEDERRLSTQQCWLRRQIEMFPASARDVRTRGRNRLLDAGQLGIQCVHCKNLPQEGRGTGSSYFPACIKSIYQSAQNMLSFHFKDDTCPLIPRRSLQQMRDAGETSAVAPRMAPGAGKSRPGGGKLFWERSAAAVTGLVDTTVGIRYSNDIRNYRPLESIALGTAGGESGGGDDAGRPANGPALTRIEDRGNVSDFCLVLLSQFGPHCSQATVSSCDLVIGDEWDSHIENYEAVPSIGLCCRYCGEGSGGRRRSKGIFLSSKADTMMRNKNLARMYNHLLECAPDDVKRKLVRAKNIHLPQSDRLKKGWKKQFFENVCNRLHESL